MDVTCMWTLQRQWEDCMLSKLGNNNYWPDFRVHVRLLQPPANRQLGIFMQEGLLQRSLLNVETVCLWAWTLLCRILPWTIELWCIELWTVELRAVELWSLEPKSVELWTVELYTIELCTVELWTVKLWTIELWTIEPWTVELRTIELLTIEL